ncbi:MAG TPA: GNAT family protein [Rhizomicrobium sp.]|nr:GNAT family protein [Rhizomicrobium sp.]
MPRLETERLILREYRLEDFPAHTAIWDDPRTTRFFSSYASGEEERWLRFLRNFGLWQLLGYGWWGLEDKNSHRYVGSVGFFQAKRPLAVSCRDLPEAGWVIAPDFHGRGLVREALTAALDWADKHIAAPESWCMINVQNAISRRVAEWAGYREIATTDYKGAPVWILTRPQGGQP